MAGHGITGFPCSSQQDLSVGDIVGVRISPVQVYCEAIGHKADAAQRDARSRRTRQSQHEASARGPRPAVIMDQRTDPSSGQKSFQVCVCASFSSTRWESLHNNTKDLIIPITNSKITFPDGVRLLRTDPPWPKDIQYVITRSVWTSDIEEWRCRGGQRYRVGQEDCDLLDVIGMEQEHSLAEKLRTYPRNGAGWLEDIKRAIAVVYAKESDDDESSKPKIFSKRAFSVRTFMSSRSRAPTVAPITEDQSNDLEDGSWSIVSRRRKPLREKSNLHV